MVRTEKLVIEGRNGWVIHRQMHQQTKIDGTIDKRTTPTPTGLEIHKNPRRKTLAYRNNLVISASYRWVK